MVEFNRTMNSENKNIENKNITVYLVLQCYSRSNCMFVIIENLKKLVKGKLLPSYCVPIKAIQFLLATLFVID